MKGRLLINSYIIAVVRIPTAIITYVSTSRSRAHQIVLAKKFLGVTAVGVTEI